MAKVNNFKNENLEITPQVTMTNNNRTVTRCYLNFAACPSTADMLHTINIKSGEGQKELIHTIQMAQAGNEYSWTYLDHNVRNYSFSDPLHKYGQMVIIDITHNDDVSFDHNIEVHTKAPFPENSSQTSETESAGGPGYAPDGWSYEEFPAPDPGTDFVQYTSSLLFAQGGYQGNKYYTSVSIRTSKSITVSPGDVIKLYSNVLNFNAISGFNNVDNGPVAWCSPSDSQKTSTKLEEFIWTVPIGVTKINVHYNTSYISQDEVVLYIKEYDPI